MVKRNKKKRLFVDAMVLAHPNMSGVGHFTLNLVEALLDHKPFSDSYELVLVAPFNKLAVIRSHFSGKAGTTKPLFLPARAIELLLRLHLLLPVDLFVGKGIYLFPNYRNWPVIRSKSYTYIHDMGFLKYPEYVQPKNLRYMKKYIPTWIKRADTIVTISKFSKHEILEAYPELTKPVEVVYPGIDTNTLKSVETRDVRRTLKKYDLPQKYVLCVGNIEPRKNLKRLIEGFGMLPSDLKKVYGLVIVGADGWLNTDIFESVETAKTSGASIVVPKQFVTDSDLPAVYSGAAAVMHPALYEGFGIPPLEAMACGVPVGVSQAGPMPEVYKGSALFFDPLNVEAIRDTMVELLRNNKIRQKLITEGLRRSKQLNKSNEAAEFTKLISIE